jgi:hypothetical protein
MPDDANLSAQERAILINRLKTANQAASEYKVNWAQKPFNEPKVLMAFAQAPSRPSLGGAPDIFHAALRGTTRVWRGGLGTPAWA